MNNCVFVQHRIDLLTQCAQPVWPDVQQVGLVSNIGWPGVRHRLS